MRLSVYIVTLTFYLMTALGCDKLEIKSLEHEKNALTKKTLLLEKENSSLKNEILVLKNKIEKFNNSPNKLYLNAVSYETSLQIEEAKSEYHLIIEWYPESKEAENSKIRLKDLEKENKSIKIFSGFKSALKSKFTVSSKAKLISLKIIDNNIIISTEHEDCDHDDIIFIDIGVAGYRANKINKLNFNKVILELHCGESRVSKHVVKKSDFILYTNAAINDTQFLRLIKQL